MCVYVCERERDREIYTECALTLKILCFIFRYIDDSSTSPEIGKPFAETTHAISLNGRVVHVFGRVPPRFVRTYKTNAANTFGSVGAFSSPKKHSG